jgi:gamma-glutamyltranspeptidase/glutathione hydrolase
LNDQIVYLDSPEFLSTSPSWRLDFAPQGIVLTTNDTLKRERYGRLLQSLARNGGESFYTGQLADYMVQCVQAAGGILSKKDLESYKPVLRKPVEIQYRGYRIMSGNAPSGGPVALSALNILEGYSDLGTISHVNVTTHRLDEALRFAFGLVSP